MTKGGMAVLIVAALVFTALGFVFGRVVSEANSSPGALVAETWVQQYVGGIMAEMQTKIDELEMRVFELSGDATVSPTVPEPSDNPTNPAPTTPKPPSLTKVKVKNSGVNIRADASASAALVNSVAANTELTYLDQKNDSDGRAWYKVKLADGKEGWVASWLCYEPE